jgi:hypothetical protein
MRNVRIGILMSGVFGAISAVLATDGGQMLAETISWTDALKQSPVAVAMLALAVLFLKYLGARDKLFANSLADLADAIRKVNPLIAAVFLVAMTSGCGPKYAGRPTEAKNTVSIYRDATGFGADATVGADTEAVIEGLEAEKKADGSMSMKLPRMQYKAAPSTTIGSWVGPMQEYKAQLDATYTGLANVATANWNGFAQAITAAAPIAGPYLDGLAKARLARAQRPKLVGELADLVMGGQMDTTAYAELGVPPDLMAAVNRAIDAKLAAIKATTRPSD